ncbi:GIY-YIG nuclease family protein, partial [Pseudoclavibacter helvolus]
AEMDAQRARLEKERAHYEKVLGQIRDLGDEVRAEEIQQKIVEIEVGIADVEYRQANQRAGYVYVISNLGAFGERVVKIGLTRRLDPMDRVRELGDASVPFMFDVHALFFSEDAVDVEAELHRRFADRRVNRINNRREFFYATPAEVREELVKIQGDLLEFVEVPEAEQFRASQAIIDS